MTESNQPDEDKSVKQTDETGTGEETSDYVERGVEEFEFRDDVSAFLRRNFPQIQMHGGESTIVDADPEDGYVEIILSGACSGCGISPMTTQAIHHRMVKELDSVENVVIHTGMDGANSTQPSFPNSVTDDDDDDNKFQAPF